VWTPRCTRPSRPSPTSIPTTTARRCIRPSPISAPVSAPRTRSCSAPRSTPARCPGSFKNLLDWSVGGGETYGKAVAWVKNRTPPTPAAPAGGAGAHDSLRAVLGYTGSRIVGEACARIPLTRQAVGEDGLIADFAVREEILAVLAALAAAADRG